MYHLFSLSFSPYGKGSGGEKGGRPFACLREEGRSEGCTDILVYGAKDERGAVGSDTDDETTTKTTPKDAARGGKRKADEKGDR